MQTNTRTIRRRISGLRSTISGVMLGAALLAHATPAAAQAPQPASRPKLGILEVEATPALAERVAGQGRDTSLAMQQVAQSLDGQLLDRLLKIQRYDLVARRDLETLLKDVDLQAAFAQNPIEAFKLARCDYGLIVTLDDFNDSRERQTGEGGTVIAERRTVRLSAVLKIYDIEKGTLAATANLQIGPEMQAVRVAPGISGATGDQFGELLVKLSQSFATRAAQAVLDSTLPARVVSVRGKQIAINRGEGTGIEAGQEWVIYARGEELIDPDTGEVLGADEAEVGRVRIDRVEQRLSWGEALEDFGISREAIARPASR